MKIIRKMREDETIGHLENMDVRSRNRVYRFLQLVSEGKSTKNFPYYVPEDDIDHG